jgi:hypothetical protein
MQRLRIFLILSFVASALIGGSLLTPGLADSGANHQIRNMHFGVSGGNVNDITRAFCCSGTLGSLVTDGTTKYILSNNHVLARVDQATAGEDVSQPGLIDNSCRVATVVADFSIAPPLGSNVDAALAELRTGTMDSTGFIEDVGVPGSPVAPSVGLGVAKSGRTTGFTTGSIGSVNTSVNVQYQKNCGSGKKFTVAYTNQVVINSTTFSAGGDSGSLIVTNNSSHNPVALLYAGSSSSTIGNPIGEVLTKLTSTVGRSISFVSGGGGGGGGGGPIAGQGSQQPYIPGFGQRELPQQAIDRVSAVLEQHRTNLMFQNGVIGVGVGASDRVDSEAAIVIYVDRTSSNKPQFAESIDGVAVRVIYTDPFVAF